MTTRDYTRHLEPGTNGPQCHQAWLDRVLTEMADLLRAKAARAKAPGAQDSLSRRLHQLRRQPPAE